MNHLPFVLYQHDPSGDEPGIDVMGHDGIDGGREGVVVGTGMRLGTGRKNPNYDENIA